MRKRIISKRYPEIVNWCYKNEIYNTREFHDFLENDGEYKISYYALIRTLSGSRTFKKEEIDIILARTKLPYEALFRKED